MTAELLSTLSVIAFVVAGVSFAASVIIWIALKLPMVIGSLSGRTARKSIALIRANNEKDNKKSYRPSVQNVARGKITSVMQTQKNDSDESTALLNENEYKPETDLLGSKNKVTVRNEATELLNDETEILQDDGSTELLNDGTELLNDNTELLNKTESSLKKQPPIKLITINEVMLIHTNEVIE